MIKLELRAATAGAENEIISHSRRHRENNQDRFLHKFATEPPPAMQLQKCARYMSTLRAVQIEADLGNL
jgi:hypothetical protein